MANLDDVNIFLPKDSEGKTPLLFNPDAIRQKQLERQEIQDQLEKELSSGDIEQAYETFTELPILDQAATYLFPPTGVPIETYEFQKFGREAKPRLKSLKEFGLDLLDPRKRMPGSLLPSPIAVEDPLAATYSGLAGLGALGGAFDLFTLPKMAIAPILRKQMKDQKDKGIGGIPSTADEQILLYAKDPDTGYVSPTIQSLIKNAPKNLKGKQITEWLAGNTNKGVKPQEVEALGIAKFIEDNPDATTRQVIENASENKVRVVQTKYVQGEGKPVVEFEVSTPDRDPLDNSLLYKPIMENIKYDLENESLTPTTAFELLETFAEANPGNPAKNFDEVKTFLESKGESLDDLIELQAKKIYQEDPYKLLEPLMPLDTGNYDKLPGFAFGNDEVGYQLFVDGKRVTDENNIAYSEMEAQIQLANKLESELGTDPLRVEGADDFYFDDEMGGAKYKNYIDKSLPGGENYREIVFSYENAPDFHDIDDHFMEGNSIAHALVRDRKLDDGSLSLHVDELQSDVHTAGSRYGYKSPELKSEFDAKFGAKEEQIQKIVDELKPIIQKYLDDYKPFPKGDDALAIEGSETAMKVIADQEVDKFFRGMKNARGTQRAMIFNDFRNYASRQLKFNIPDFDFMDNLKREIDSSRELSEKYLKAVPNYPYKKDWYVMSLKQLIRNAIEEGKDSISVSTSAPILARYTDQYEKFYKTLYDEKIPSAMKKLANKYGGKFEKGSLSEIDTFGKGEYIEGGSRIDDIRQGDFESDLVYSMDPSDTKKFLEGVEPKLKANIIRITPEMKEKILTEGFESFGSGGSVDKPKSVLDDINIFTET
jgi:hypothetical protein